jgi:anthranilate synthase component 2
VALLIIDNYDSFTYNLVQMVEQAGAKDYLLLKNDRLDNIDSTSFEKVLISPGPGISSEAGQLLPFIKQYYQTKDFLGVCLGFEALLEFLGAPLSLLPEPMHGIQNQGILLQKDKIFSGLPETFKIGHYHSWFVKEEDFPEDCEVLMKDELGLIMAFRHKKYALRAVHFHPESYMTPLGVQIIRNWMENQHGSHSFEATAG